MLDNIRAPEKLREELLEKYPGIERLHAPQTRELLTGIAREEIRRENEARQDSKVISMYRRAEWIRARIEDESILTEQWPESL